MQKADLVTKTPREKAPTDFTEQLIEPFHSLRSEVDRLFDSFGLRMPRLQFGHFPLPAMAPAIEMKETPKRYKISAELPGIAPEDVEVTFEDGMLRIAGEKKEEREEDEKGYRYAERSYGAFERLISLPSAADEGKIDARFRDGVLTVTIAKVADDKRKPRRIDVNKA